MFWISRSPPCFGCHALGVRHLVLWYCNRDLIAASQPRTPRSEFSKAVDGLWSNVRELSSVELLKVEAAGTVISALCKLAEQPSSSAPHGTNSTMCPRSASSFGVKPSGAALARITPRSLMLKAFVN